MKTNKEKIDSLRLEADDQERKFEYQTVARIRYSDIPGLEKENEAIERDLAAIRERGESYLRERVDLEDIAEIIAKWTGIPVGKLVEHEREKYLHLFQRLQTRVV